MTKNLPELIGKLEELEKKATPGPLYAHEMTEEADPFPTRKEGWDLQSDDRVFTVSPEKDKPGWETDCGHCGYGISDFNATLLAESRNALPTLLTALKEAIDLIETLEKVFEKYPMYARLSAEKMEPIGNPCTEFLKKWTTE